MEEKKTDLQLNDLVRVDNLQLLYHQSYPAIFVSLFSAVLLSRSTDQLVYYPCLYRYCSAHPVHALQSD